MERTGDVKNACVDRDGITEQQSDARLRRTVPTEIACAADIRPAAEALRDIAKELGNFRAAACDNIASKMPMHDAEGNILACDVFGWPGSKEQWWKKPLLALSSPLPIAC